MNENFYTDQMKKQFNELVELIKKGDYFEYREELEQFQDVNYIIFILISNNVFFYFYEVLLMLYF